MKQNRFTYAAAVGAAVPNALRRKSDRKSERKLVEGVAESEGVPACNVEGCPHPDDSLDRTRLALATCDMCSDSFHVGCASRQLTPSGEKRFPGECGRCGILARLFCLFCGMGSENRFPVLVTCATCKRGFHKNCRKSGDSHSSTCGRHLCVGQPPVKWACTASPNPDDGQAAADTGAAAARAEKAEGMAAQQQAAGNMDEAQLEEAPPTFAAVVRAEPGDGLVEKHKLSLIPKKEAGDADAADPGPEVENEADAEQGTAAAAAPLVVPGTEQGTAAVETPAVVDVPAVEAPVSQDMPAVEAFDPQHKSAEDQPVAEQGTAAAETPAAVDVPAVEAPVSQDMPAVKAPDPQHKSAEDQPVAEQGTAAAETPAAVDVPAVEAPVSKHQSAGEVPDTEEGTDAGETPAPKVPAAEGAKNAEEQPHFTKGVLLDEHWRHRLAEGGYCVGQLQDTISAKALVAEFQKDLAPNSAFRNNFRAFKKKANGELDTLKDPKRWIGNLVEGTPFYKRFEQVAEDVMAAVGDTFGKLEVPKGDMARTALLTYPAALVQEKHRDYGALSVMLVLTDMYPFTVYPQSHKLGDGATPDTLRPVTCFLPAKSVVIFDGRLIHNAVEMHGGTFRASAHTYITAAEDLFPENTTFPVTGSATVTRSPWEFVVGHDPCRRKHYDSQGIERATTSEPSQAMTALEREIDFANAINEVDEDMGRSVVLGEPQEYDACLALRELLRDTVAFGRVVYHEQHKEVVWIGGPIVKPREGAKQGTACWVYGPWLVADPVGSKIPRRRVLFRATALNSKLSLLTQARDWEVVYYDNINAEGGFFDEAYNSFKHGLVEEGVIRVMKSLQAYGKGHAETLTGELKPPVTAAAAAAAAEAEKKEKEKKEKAAAAEREKEKKEKAAAAEREKEKKEKAAAAEREKARKEKAAAAEREKAKKEKAAAAEREKAKKLRAETLSGIKMALAIPRGTKRGRGGSPAGTETPVWGKGPEPGTRVKARRTGAEGNISETLPAFGSTQRVPEVCDPLQSLRRTRSQQAAAAAVEGGSDRKRRSPCPVHGPRAAQSEPDELSDTDTEQAEASIPRGPLSARAPRALEELDTQVGTPSGPFEHSPGGVLDPLNLFNDSVGRNTPIDSRMHHHSADAAELFNRERAATGSLTTDLARPRSEGWEGRREVTPSSAEPPVLASKARQAEIAELEAQVRIQALKMQLAQGAAALAQAGIASAASPGPEVGATAAATAAAPQAAATAAASPAAATAAAPPAAATAAAPPAAATAAAPPAAATAAAPPAAATAAAPPAAATAAAPPAAATAAAPPAAATTDAPPAAATATAPSAAAPSRPVLFHAPSSPGETAPPEMPYEWVYGGVYYNSDSVPPQHHGRALAALPQYPPMMLGLDPYPAQTPYAQTYRAPHGRAAHDAMLPGYALAVQQQYPEQLVTMPLRQAMRLNAALSRQLPPEWSSQPRQSWDPFYGPGMRRP
ncbi:hypothetical protein CYMTET_56041 [Cymbomonas tetramitiformis]|uniref:Zinc finger PHD-type domain-containing protein n=1 Tax=Cymbomonas tetramitiformis TaxID=36881 RepID=A0AAE0BCZ6_9CHLO|nr:hypothetical protein CYMTET_56041 [Cymbomonas tetramitiformis]